MREIKFRAWDKEGKHMVKVQGLDFRVGKIGKLFGSDERGFWHDMDLQYYELMQFTGLLDRNSKEIYEGDILEFGGLKPIVIEWRDVGFKSKLVPYDNSEPIHLTQLGMSEFGEVIGNIYENPELLDVNSK